MDIHDQIKRYCEQGNDLVGIYFSFPMVDFRTFTKQFKLLRLNRIKTRL